MFLGGWVCYTSGKEKVSQYTMRSTGKSGRSEGSHVRFFREKDGHQTSGQQVETGAFLLVWKNCDNSSGTWISKCSIPSTLLCGLGYSSFILPSNNALWWSFLRGAPLSPGFCVSSLVPPPCARGEDELRSGRMSFISSYPAPLPGRKGP